MWDITPRKLTANQETAVSTRGQKAVSILIIFLCQRNKAAWPNGWGAGLEIRRLRAQVQL